MAVVTATASAQNTFTSWLDPSLRLGPRDETCTFNVSISGSISGSTVTLQRSFDDGSTPLDVKAYTAIAEEIAVEPEAGVLYRIGIKTGDYVGGSVSLRLSN